MKSIPPRPSKGLSGLEAGVLLVLLRLRWYGEGIRPLPLSVKRSRAMRTPRPLAVLGICRCGYLCVDGLLPYLRPQPARHSSSAAVLAGLHVVEVRHGLVE